MASITVVINPNSRRNSTSLRSRVVRSLAREHDVESVVTRARGDGTKLARKAVADGAAIIVTMGGDGTVNEVALSLEDQPVLLCPLPIGGTNVFARSLGWPSSPDAAVSVFAGAVNNPEAHAVDIRAWRIAVEGSERLVCLNAGVGIDAETVAEVERRPIAKRFLGQGAFAVAAAAAAETTARRGEVMALRSDGDPPIEFASTSMAIGGPYAYLGRTPLDLLPDAQFDGRLHWLGLHGGRRADIARVARGALTGDLGADQVALVRGAASRELTVSCSTEVAVQVDGEPLGLHREIHFSPGGRVRVLAPDAEFVAQVRAGASR